MVFITTYVLHRIWKSIIYHSQWAIAFVIAKSLINGYNFLWSYSHVTVEYIKGNNDNHKRNHSFWMGPKMEVNCLVKARLHSAPAFMILQMQSRKRVQNPLWLEYLFYFSIMLDYLMKSVFNVVDSRCEIYQAISFLDFPKSNCSGKCNQGSHTQPLENLEKW